MKYYVYFYIDKVDFRWYVFQIERLLGTRIEFQRKIFPTLLLLIFTLSCESFYRKASKRNVKSLTINRKKAISVACFWRVLLPLRNLPRRMCGRERNRRKQTARRTSNIPRLVRGIFHQNCSKSDLPRSRLNSLPSSYGFFFFFLICIAFVSFPLCRYVGTVKLLSRDYRLMCLNMRVPWTLKTQCFAFPTGNFAFYTAL